MARTNPRALARVRRKKHIRKRVRGTTERPRLCVFRSTKHIYAQIIDDETGRTIATASTVEKDVEIEGGKGNTKAAVLIGTAVSRRAQDAGLKQVVFDRNGYLYHGRVKALADAARKEGLEF